MDRDNMPKINFITVCTDRYPLVYAEKITRQFKKLTNLNVEYFCLTDRPRDIGDWATPLELPVKSDGWWNKVNLFSSDMPEGWILYLDIDIVIMHSFDEEILWTISQDQNLACISDAIHWMGEKFSSSLMLFKSGTQEHVYKKFMTEHNSLATRDGGDQVWVGPQLSNILYIDEQYPNLKKNLKFNVAQRNGDQLTFPALLDPTIKMLDCGGRPKPHELTMLPYVKKNWHDVV
jgi:hypothetical protein